MAQLEITRPAHAARPASAQDLLKIALQLPNVRGPRLDPSGAIAMTPMHPMRGRAAEPATPAIIRFPQAEAGHAKAVEAARTQGLMLDPMPIMVAARPTLPPEGSIREQKAAPEVPTRQTPAILTGFLTQAMDRTKAKRFGR